MSTVPIATMSIIQYIYKINVLLYAQKISKWGMGMMSNICNIWKHMETYVSHAIIISGIKNITLLTVNVTKNKGKYS